MAQRLTFHYFPVTSCLHSWDGRCKFLGLLAVTATLVQTRVSWLLLDTALLLVLLALSRLPVRLLLRDVWKWVIFLFLLFLVQVFFTPGHRFDFLPWLPVSKEGLFIGGLTFCRWLLLVSYAILFTAVTRPRDLQDALTWFLRPVSFLPGRRIGLMVSLTLRLFTLILDQSEEVRLAHRARFGEHGRNPLRRIKFMVLPILRRSLIRAEDMTLALAARGYRDDVPLQYPKLSIPQAVPLVIFVAVLITLKLFFL